MNQQEIDNYLIKIWDERYVNTTNSFELAKKCLETSEKEKYTKGIAYALLYSNLFSFWLIKDAEVLSPILKAVKLLNETNEAIGLTRAYNILASIYDNYGDYNAAIKYSQLAIKTAKANDYKEEEGDACTTLGQIYSRIEDYNGAIEMLEKGLKFREEADAQFAVSSSLNLIARTYTLSQNYENAIVYYNKSLALREAIGDQNGLPWTFLGFASMYQQMGELEQASAYYNRALSNKNENKRLELLCLIGLGKIASANEQLEKGLDYLNDALKTAKELKMKSLIYDIHLSLAKIYEKKKNTPLELEHFKAFYQIKEVVINAEMTNKLKKQQIAFSVERSQKEAEIYQLKNVELKKAYHIVNEKNREITDSINYAKRIQDALFPTLANFYKSFPKSYLIYKPKDIVAGDFYWMEKVENKMLFAVADCTGHGVPGAMVSVICNNALNRAVREFKITQPSAILDKVTELVKYTFEKSEEKVLDGMDISLCSFNLATRELEFAGANNSLYIITKNKEKFIEFKDNRTVSDAQANLITIPANKQPIGNFDYLEPFTNHQLQLEKGDFICLFSDGYADQFGGEKGKKFKYAPFKRLLLSSYHLSFNQQQDLIASTFDQWKGDLEQIDDVCVMGINIE